jgi:hypothetical protein
MFERFSSGRKPPAWPVPSEKIRIFFGMALSHAGW